MRRVGEGFADVFAAEFGLFEYREPEFVDCRFGLIEISRRRRPGFDEQVFNAAFGQQA